ncbi:hypothetical protein BJ944DRAFT_252602 [Cunninghamella echinulata]|nr:hypothetical protein BJ944DRAFT_252602 [Cunninghamella echinulata]
MGSLFSKEKATDPNDYEKVLSELDEKIQKVEARLSEIKLRQRRTGALWLIYSTLLWSVYLAYCFLTLNTNDIPMDVMVVQFLPVFVIPIAIYYMRKALTWFYARKQTSEENNLTELRSQQKQKVEELKKKTSYYTTQSLLERYDQEALAKKKQLQQQQQQAQFNQRKPVSMPAPGTRLIPPPNTQQPPPSHPQLGNRGMPLQPPLPQQQPSPSSVLPPNGMMNIQHQMVSQTPMTRASPQWYDKIIDALIGEDGPETKYALICHHCYAHNGLILPTEVDTIQYTCPVCKKFNPSRKSRQLHPDGPVLPPRTPSPSLSPSVSNDRIRRDTNEINHHQEDSQLNIINNNSDDDVDGHDEKGDKEDTIADRVRRRRVKDAPVVEDDDDVTIEN